MTATLFLLYRNLRQIMMQETLFALLRGCDTGEAARFFLVRTRAKWLKRHIIEALKGRKKACFSALKNFLKIFEKSC